MPINGKQPIDSTVDSPKWCNARNQPLKQTNMSTVWYAVCPEPHRSNQYSYQNKKIKNKTASYGLQNEKLRLFIFLISSQMQCLTADLQRGVLLSLYIPQVQTGTEHPAPSWGCSTFIPCRSKHRSTLGIRDESAGAAASQGKGSSASTSWRWPRADAQGRGRLRVPSCIDPSRVWMIDWNQAFHNRKQNP